MRNISHYNKFVLTVMKNSTFFTYSGAEAMTDITDYY